MTTAGPGESFRRLYAAYGPQGWWPLTPRRGQAPVYDPGRRGALGESELLEICVGAILTQNTNWRNVEHALRGLWRVLPDPTWARLAEMPRPRLEAAVRPSGYFRQKARKLRVFARAVLARGGSVRSWLRSGSMEARREELLGLWGIGPETADSILLYAGRRPSFVIDAYTRRIGERLGWWRQPTNDEAREHLIRSLPAQRGLYAEFHALFVRLAKENCRIRPDCAPCPLRPCCPHACRRSAGGRRRQSRHHS